ncbi:serine O-succinyltransferase [Elsinoe australis]|uniref:Serine O-succinyltransferase n=1 Tax=Elsinoe australis TaxID=40998 RepID=A0A4U7B529_9PEZI|nr:serine O-succinyltransferase [Elsinoe australis]
MSISRPLMASGRAMRLEIQRRASQIPPRFLAQHVRPLQHSTKQAAQAAAASQHEDQSARSQARPPPSNTPLSFPCLDASEQRTQQLASKRSQRSSLSGPEPSYTSGHTELFTSEQPLLLDWGGVLPSFTVAYETWGELNAEKSNAILLHTGLSASSHAHSTEKNPKPGWWEKFIGLGAPLDTNKYFVICTNVLGGCYGSTGPSSADPSAKGTSEEGRRWATRFPILTMQDMVRAQYKMLDWFGIEKLYASVGSSMGGMQSLAMAVLEKDRVVLMNDPAWASTRGNYYDSIPPHSGMKLAREIATVTYRSGPEWENRFGRRRADPSKPPALCPDFLIETYLDHAGEKWCLEYDANSLLYVSKAMDLFDLGAENMSLLDKSRRDNIWKLEHFQNATAEEVKDSCSLTLPDEPYEEQENSSDIMAASSDTKASHVQSGPPEDLIRGLSPMKDIPTLVLGVASDILFPAWQQREIAETLRRAGNRSVTHVELGEDRSLFGHDTFLLDLEGVGGEIRRFLG